MSHSANHDKRLKKLLDGVKAYAAAEGIKETTASLRIFKDGKELGRLSEGGSTKPATLEKYEARLKSWKSGVNPDQAVSA